MKVRRTKIIIIGIFSVSLMLTAVLSSAPTGAASLAGDDPAAIYKAKCAMCHGPTAAKAFDPAKPEPELVETILKGKKGEKPPYMPEYGTKGISEETAKALVAHMKTLRASAN